jgi:hypothetical protein
MRTLTMIQGVGSHQLLKIWEQLQKFRISGQRPSCNSKGDGRSTLHKMGEDSSYSSWGFGKKKITAKFISQTHGWAHAAMTMKWFLPNFSMGWSAIHLNSRLFSNS